MTSLSLKWLPFIAFISLLYKHLYISYFHSILIGFVVFARVIKGLHSDAAAFDEHCCPNRYVFCFISF